MPRPNGYQSLHTSVISEHGTPFEVQIRTAEMHHQAEEGHRRALEVQGRPRRRSARRALLPVDAAAARVAAGGPRPAGVHPEPEARSLSGGGLHLHAERRGEGAAPRRDAGRLRVRHPHRRRPPLRRRARERQDGAAAHAPEERRHRRDRHAGDPHAEPRLAQLRGHLARAEQDPPLRPGRGEGPQHRARTPHLREGGASLRPQHEDAARERGDGEGRRGVRRRTASTNCWRRSATASCAARRCSASWCRRSSCRSARPKGRSPRSSGACSAAARTASR